MERLQKVIAASGISSRRHAEELITQGKVKVNGIVVTTLGSKVDPFMDQLVVEGKKLAMNHLVTYAFYKPKGVVCSRKQQANEKIVTAFLPTTPPVYPIGRLDKASEGLLLLTNQGDLANKLTHPSFKHQKEYFVEARFEKDAQVREPEWIIRQLTRGVKLGDGLAKADAVTVTFRESVVSLKIVIHEGRHHLLRRMCASIGLEVTRLKRLRIGNLKLDKLQPGQYRVISQTEVKNLL